MSARENDTEKGVKKPVVQPIPETEEGGQNEDGRNANS